MGLISVIRSEATRLLLEAYTSLLVISLLLESKHKEVIELMPTPEDLTIPDKLDSLKATKQAIRQAIEAKGVTVPTDATFYEYSDSIAEISTGTPLPEGGTAGQVLTKTADGIAWQDAQGGEEYVLPQATSTALGGVKAQEHESSIQPGNSAKVHIAGTPRESSNDLPQGTLYVEAADLDGLGAVKPTTSSSYNQYTKYAIDTYADSHGSIYAVLPAVDFGTMGGVRVEGDLPESDADYDIYAVTVLGGTEPTPAGYMPGTLMAKIATTDNNEYGVVSFASNEDFCAYMGIEYNASDWT